LFGDTDAAMGGECMTNFPIDAVVGELLYRVPEGSREEVGRELWGMDVIAAPGYSSEALEMLGKRAKRSLLANPALLHPEVASASEWMYRSTEGGFLRQKSYHFTLPPESLPATPEMVVDLVIAWAVAWRAKSNSVALARDGQLIALGAGQQDRRSCVLLLLDRAKNARHDTAGAVFGSDGFFPFARRASEDKPLEAPELLIEAGCIGGVVPEDGVRIEEVKALFAEHGLNVVYVDKTHRGFAWH
jgi:phosphoribosylaminoimidazolecarboxamide formyltransferase/IMP cyclohydrolase